MDAKAESAREVEPNAKIFISYSRRDIAFADRLEAAIKPRGRRSTAPRSELLYGRPPIQLHA